MRPQRGLTMIEMLVTLAVAITLAGFALVPMVDFIERQAAVAAINRLIGTVQFARAAAISLRTRTIVCPRSRVLGDSAAATCGGHADWHRGQIVFADRNRDSALSGDDDVLRVASALPAGARVFWRSFRNRPYLTFEANGLTAWQNGHFLYCPPSDDPHDARQIVLNPQGRLRQMVDSNGDGIVEDTAGRPVVCTRTSGAA